MNPTPAFRQVAHASYRRHRRQIWTHILLPVLLGAALFTLAPVFAWLMVMHGGGDVSRWAAISTMWLLIPVMIGGMIVLAVLAALIFVMSRVGGWIPRYSSRAQGIASRAASGSRRAAEMVRRPVLAVRAAGSLVKSRLRRLRERV